MSSTTRECVGTSDSSDPLHSGIRDTSAGSDDTEEGKGGKPPRRPTGAGVKDAALGSERHHVLVGTPFGGLYVVAAEGSVVAIYHEAHDPAPGPADLGRPLYTPDEASKDDVPRAAGTASAAAMTAEASAADTEVLHRARQELVEYFDGRRRSFSFPMVTTGTAFQEDVWRSIARVPFGERRSYRDIAGSLGNPKMGRAIGAAVRANPLSIAIPGHRVVSSSGKVVGYAAGTDVKSALLEFERSLCATPEPTGSEVQGTTPDAAPISTPDHIR